MTVCIWTLNVCLSLMDIKHVNVGILNEFFNSQITEITIKFTNLIVYYVAYIILIHTQMHRIYDISAPRRQLIYTKPAHT